MTLLTNITKTHNFFTWVTFIEFQTMIRSPFSNTFQKTSDRWPLSVSFLIHVTSKMVECVPLTNAGDALLGCSHVPATFSS